MIRFVDFAAWTGAVLSGPVPECFQRVTFDSRKVTPGCLYMAFPGATRDGHEFVLGAIKSGAAAALVRNDWHVEGEASLPLVRVANPKAALPIAAKAYRKMLKAKIIGVTGSAGKTTVKELTAEFLRSGGKKVYATEGNFNNDLGLPITILCCPNDAEFLVAEMGTNHPGEIAYLVDIAKPEVGLISSIGTAHIEFFITQDGIAEEKGTLFRNLPADGFAVLSSDNARYERLVKMSSARVITVDPGSEMWRKLEDALRVRLPGRHNVSNALIAMACARQFGVGDVAMIASLKDFKLPGGRWRVIEHLGVTYIDDTYNANPTAMIAALETFASLKVNGRRIAVLGDMFELGDKADELHAEVGECVKSLHLDMTISVGELACRNILAEQRCIDAKTAKTVLAEVVHPGDTVLLKASHGMHLDQVLP